MTPRLLAALAVFAVARAADSAPETPVYGLVIHGGAGTLSRQNLSPEMEAHYRAKLTEARDVGYAVLERGGTAVEAVTATIIIMEDSPLFNAGKGAVLSNEGLCELDASIMDGRTLGAGAIAGVKHIRNPILLARAVMEKSEHVMLSGDGAEKFAQQSGFQLVPNEYFQTEARRRQLEEAKRPAKTPAKPAAAVAPAEGDKHGTVGCVALDREGNLAAGTSTGGMTNKRFGRIGDSPIIGAGTYAANASCAVSATGWGEYFIRVGVARDIAAQVEYRGTPLAEAAAASIAKVGKLGGDGGVIAINRRGEIALPFNSGGMYRGYRLSNGQAAIDIFGSSAK